MANPQATQQWESVTLPPRLPLVIIQSNRDGTLNKDARLVNCYLEATQEGEANIFKRPGITQTSVVSANEVGNGVFFWNGDVYSVFGSVFYRNGAVVSGVDNTGGVYRFISILGATPKLVFSNGKKAYAYDTGGGLSSDLHTIDADYPTTTVKGLAYLNGPVYVMQPEAVIWGSAINSVSVAGDWDPLNYLRAQIEPDGGVFLAKQLVYVVALKKWTIEYFFDAGQPTGSPLQSVQGMKVNYGCASADSVRAINDVLFFLSTDQNASLQVSQLDKGAHSVVSTPAVDRLLCDINTSVVFSWTFKINGHSFYVLTFKQSNLTLVYDVNQQLWYQWTTSSGNYLPFVDCTYDASGEHVLQHETNGALYTISSTDYKDDSNPIVVDIITPSFDAQTFRRKHLNMLKFVGDRVPGSVLQVRKTDDDYQTWSNFRRVDLNLKVPKLVNCGTFVRRAYHLRHTANTPFRIRALDAQYDVGTL